ncbi:MAG: MBL fold metallo-hydrolase [Candidatus Krumholzibacteriaceae bacterium]|jgi:glyoxylase-like metal-dependent hydrolase (beta-lactamase superfamily II)
MKKEETVRIACKVVGPIETNCYILSSPERKAVIVDPGGDADTIEAYIEETRLEPVEIVSTHGHSDHIAAVGELKERYGIPFAVHEADASVVKLSVREAPFWGMGKIKDPRIDRALRAGDTIVFGSARGRVLHTPGHTPGGISILFDGFVLVGDTLFNRSIGRTDLTGGDLDTLLESIRTQLFTLPDETVVYCGHGPRTTIGEERRENPFFENAPREF